MIIGCDICDDVTHGLLNTSDVSGGTTV